MLTIQPEYITLTIAIIMISVVFYGLRRGLRVVMMRWLGSDRFGEIQTLHYRNKITRVVRVLYLVSLWIVFQSTTFYHEFIVMLSDRLLIKSEYIVINGYTIAKAILLAYVGFELLQLSRGLVRLQRRTNEEYYQTIDGVIFHTGIVIIVLIVLGSLGASWKLLVPLASVLGVAIGFGLQDVAKNIISGIIILSGDTPNPGDWVTVGNYFGKIHHIGLRSSVIRTLDYLEVVVPNSDLTNEQLINRSYNDHKVRIAIPVGVSYRSDIHVVTQALLDAAHTIKTISAKPEPDVTMMGFGSSSVNFELRVWINVKKVVIPTIKSDLYYAVWDQFKRHKIEIPYPQQDVWFRNAIPTSVETNITSQHTDTSTTQPR